jgi:hypothetical protein
MSDEDSSYGPTVFKIVLVIIIVVSLGLAYYFLRNSPVGKAAGDLFGALDGILLALNNEINSCNKNGWGRCWLTYLGIGVAILWGIAKFGRLFGRFFRGGKLQPDVEKLQQFEPDKSYDELVTETMDSANVREIVEKGLSPDVTEAAIKTAVTRTVNTRIVESIRSKSLNPVELGKQLAAQQQRYEEMSKDIAEDLNAEETKQVDETMDSVGIKEPVFVE